MPDTPSPETSAQQTFNEVERIEPIEPQWTPLEEAMFLAGLVPVRRVTREELLEEGYS